MSTPSLKLFLRDIRAAPSSSELFEQVLSSSERFRAVPSSSELFRAGLITFEQFRSVRAVCRCSEKL